VCGACVCGVCVLCVVCVWVCVGWGVDGTQIRRPTRSPPHDG
jgi:hypothetical protein